jgi:hypothetical protein
MPLLAYFVTVGAALTALLLLVNVMLEPSKPERPKPAAAGVATSLPKPRVTTGSAQPSLAPTARAGEDRPPLPTATRETLVQPVLAQPLSQDEAKRKSFTSTAPKGKTVKPRARGRNADDVRRRYRDDSGYSSRAQEWPTRSYSAEGTLGPH